VGTVVVALLWVSGPSLSSTARPGEGTSAGRRRRHRGRMNLRRSRRGHEAVGGKRGFECVLLGVIKRGPDHRAAERPVAGALWPAPERRHRHCGQARSSVPLSLTKSAEHVFLKKGGAAARSAVNMLSCVLGGRSRPPRACPSLGPCRSPLPWPGGAGTFVVAACPADKSLDVEVVSETEGLDVVLSEEARKSDLP